MNEFFIYALIFLLFAMAFLLKPFKPALAKIQIAIACLFSVVVLWVYYKTGYIQEWEKFEFKESKVNEMLQELRSPDKVIARLEAKLEEEPKSAEGWFLLGRLYRSNNEIAKAVSAFKKARVLDGADQRFLDAYLEARYWDNGGLYRAEDLKLIAQSKDFNPEVLNLIAGYYFQHQDYKQAISYWQKMANQVSDDPAVQQEVMRAIEAAQGKEKLQTKGQLVVNVDVSDAIKNKYAAEASVFILAKISRTGPPVAVVRRNLSELATSITLSDAEAIMMSRVLSQYQGQEIIVGARIEPTGKLTQRSDNPRVYQKVRFTKSARVSLMISK